jgi:hypothetical protein
MKRLQQEQSHFDNPVYRLQRKVAKRTNQSIINKRYIHL